MSGRAARRAIQNKIVSTKHRVWKQPNWEYCWTCGRHSTHFYMLNESTILRGRCDFHQYETKGHPHIQEITADEIPAYEVMTT